VKPELLFGRADVGLRGSEIARARRRVDEFQRIRDQALQLLSQFQD
jgi:hypothetical protein